MNPDWARAVKKQCREAGIPFFFKQMAGKRPIPYDLRIREFPRWPRSTRRTSRAD
jgi:protein gp37